MKVSKRLEHVAQFVPHGARMADIGSDHAYLPSFLVKQGKVSFAIAGEVVSGPFKSAQETIQEEALTECITVRLGNGLDVVMASDNIDTITICGMGGELIAQILERGFQQGKLVGVTTLILQPNVAEQQVREWLMRHCYQIIDEVIMQENQKRYEIIVAIPSSEPVSYTSEQLQFGVYLPLEKNAVYIEKWTAELDKIDKIISSLEKASTDESNRIALFQQQRKIIKEMMR